MSITLPHPDEAAAQHSARLTEHICSEIVANGGWITFARYMELALYAPGLGYYTAGSRKFGMAGDFVTAPELSPMFGRTLARQVAEIMEQSAPHILELGAGSGKLVADVLGELERIGRLPECYSILEVSADLRERQQVRLHERMPHLAARVKWLDALPEKFSGVVVANEVLDALPVHLVHWRDSAITERGVALARSTPPDARPPGGTGAAWDEKSFIWQERGITDSALLEAAEKVIVPDGYVSEICLAARGLVNSLTQMLGQGVLLFFDYGFGAPEYYHPQRNKGTLMCHYRHHAHDDPFFLTGLQDITAHVNFTAVADCGLDAGLELMGYTSQAHFLLNSGIAEFLEEVQPENLRDYLPLSAQLQTLTSPAEMGELFKVMALGKKMENPLSGFARGDLARSL